MAYTLINLVSSKPVNSNVGYNNSWLEIENDANRDLFAQASYITNFDDLTISLSAGNVTIGAVEIKDGNSGLKADVTASDGLNALRVLTQDLESDVDDITIGDRDKNYATVNPSTSSLRVDITNAVTVSNPVTAIEITNTNIPVSYADSASLDAFGRLRVSQPTTLFDSKSIYNKGRFFWNDRQRDAEEIFLENDSSRIAYLTANNAFYVKETYRRFAYQPGKSHLLFFTGVLSAEVDVIKRVGLFTSLSDNEYTDKTEGIYFQAYKTSALSDAESYAWVINNNTNLVPSQSAMQVNWNIDKMDGSGPSNVTLDFSKVQIFVVDYEWLGSGRVRCGFNVDGITYYCHQFLNANNITGTYMTRPNLPIRAELRSVGASSGSMKTICASVMSEGGVSSPSFITRSVSLSASINPTVGNRRGLLGVRMNPARAEDVNEIVSINVFPQVVQQNSFAPFKWELVMRPTPATGRTWLDVSTSSNLQYAVGSTNLEITGGEIVISGFGNRELRIALDEAVYEKILKLGKDLDGITDELWIVVTPIADNQPLWAAFTIAEAD